jgi:hypothetical protein
MENNPVLPVGLVTRSCWLAQQTQKSLMEKTRKRHPRRRRQKPNKIFIKVGKEKKKTRIVPVSKPITQIHPTECNCPRLLQIFLNPQKLQQQEHHLICLSVSDQ